MRIKAIKDGFTSDQLEYVQCKLGSEFSSTRPVPSALPVVARGLYLVEGELLSEADQVRFRGDIGKLGWVGGCPECLGRMSSSPIIHYRGTPARRQY